MTERATSPQPQPAQLQRELEESNTEVERLRGLLVARDLELGAAKGKLAELEDHLRRLTRAVQRILRLPGLVGLAIAALRALGRPRRKQRD
jgi:hypothetical protein